MKIIVDKTADFFGENTPLKTIKENYENRSQQQEMAIAVAKSLQERKHLCVEAPTGVGKSFAYLVPAMFYSKYHEKKVVISTHTINLQEQLINKDIAALKNIFPQKLEVALAKGRNNFLCLRRLESAWQVPEDYLFIPETLTELNRIKNWSISTMEGSRSDLSPLPDIKIWGQICCEHGNCQAQHCPFFYRCFFMKMRAKLESADIIITNHSLFFVDMAMKKSGENEEKPSEGILPSFSAVIFDEAHTMEESASMHLGLHLSSSAFFHMLNRLFLRGKDEKSNRGLLKNMRWELAQNAVESLRYHAEYYFSQLNQWVVEQKSAILSYTEPKYIENILKLHCQKVCSEIDDVIALEVAESNQTELKALKEQIQGFCEGLNDFLDMEIPDSVYWLESSSLGNNNRYNLELYAIPIEIDKCLENNLFSKSFTVIMTSATLAVDQNLFYFLKRIGNLNCEKLILDSPFDYKKQVEIIVPKNLPSPKNETDFLPAAEAELKQFLLAGNRKNLVLFTSYFMMNEMVSRLRKFLQNHDIDLFIQGEKFSNSAIVELFKESESATIFGTSSFWTGVDIPGNALTGVIIVRIPFAVPSHPLNKARGERIEERNLNSFQHYSLPEAILRFRQGFGRLIRSKSDVGRVIILDSRVISTTYGAKILKSLPECKITIK